MIDDILKERSKTHGNWYDNAAISQSTKDLWGRSPNWEHLTISQRESLDMIAHKVGRILAGDPNHPDHWDDIAGYATLGSPDYDKPE